MGANLTPLAVKALAMDPNLNPLAVILSGAENPLLHHGRISARHFAPSAVILSEAEESQYFARTTPKPKGHHHRHDAVILSGAKNPLLYHGRISARHFAPSAVILSEAEESQYFARATPKPKLQHPTRVPHPLRQLPRPKAGAPPASLVGCKGWSQRATDISQSPTPQTHPGEAA